MDPKDKKIEELTKSVETLTGQLKVLTETNTKLQSDNVEKDKIIKEKTNDVVGARKEYKKLADMTQAEKDALSAKELELQERTENMEIEKEKMRKDQEERDKKIWIERRDNTLRRVTGNNKDLFEKAKLNFDRIKDSDKAITDEEITKFASDAYNMIGSVSPNPVREVIIGGVGDAGGESGQAGFAESPAGKSLAGALNLPTPPANK